jgi:hypothetical protein
MDKFFKRMSIVDITAMKVKAYVEHARRAGYADPTIRRQLGRLRSAFYLAKENDLINDGHTPTFKLPRDSDPCEGFLDVPDFEKLRDAMPEHLQSAVTFLFTAGFVPEQRQKLPGTCSRMTVTKLTSAANSSKTRKPSSSLSSARCLDARLD